MPTKRRGRKPQNISEDDKRRPCTIRASKAEYEVIKVFVKFLRKDMEKCCIFLGIPQAANTVCPPSPPAPEPCTVKESADVSSTLTLEQQDAFAAMADGHNVFLSGGAGTGKTYVLEHFIQYAQDEGKTVLRMAPTGIAARIIKGTTIHRAIHAPTTVIGPDNFQLASYAHQMGKKVYEVIARTDILIVDEISMCRSDLFAYLAKIILAEDQLHVPFRFDAKEEDTQKDKKLTPIRHHIQLILCGDFAQLPPIIGKDSREVWRRCYPENEAGWPFLTAQWDALKLKIFDLKKVIRQADPAFAEALNLIRRGNPAGIQYINENSSKMPQPNCMTVCTKNSEVDRINKEHYSQLDTQYQKTYRLEEEGDVTDDDKRNIPGRLKLTPGARILFLANDTEENPPRYSNGSFGTVTATKMDSVMVELDSGSEIEVKRKIWQVTRPVLIEDEDTGEKRVEEKVVGKFSQIPVMLGWAITIHKSQGQSYDAMNVDPANIFAPGQLYVALSRCKDVHKMHLSRPLVPSDVLISDAVKRFYGWIEQEVDPKKKGE
ncbi:ATP-dependent RecD-like DNA helicase [Megasphaera indica]|jgi:ATP-dependent exoDNAse (exonuclease V) alpha subunit